MQAPGWCGAAARDDERGGCGRDDMYDARAPRAAPRVSIDTKVAVVFDTSALSELMQKVAMNGSRHAKTCPQESNAFMYGRGNRPAVP